MAISIPFPHVPPIWLEGRLPLEAAALMRSDVWSGVGVPAGGGRAVLLIPGFMAGDGTLGTMAGWLNTHGWRVKRAGFRANVACSQAACERLEERLEALAAETGSRVMIIGQSRGGVLARALGARRPDLVSGIVTLGSPVVSQLAVHPLVLGQVLLVGAMGTGRIPGLFSLDCLRGDCCETFRADLAGDFPPEVGYVAVYSRTDGIVDWRSCLDPGASDHVEISASHCGMSLNHHAYRAVAVALGAFAEYEDGLARAA
jgi:pimeloyl-ACP methyl ester carboxylesterase